MQKTTKQFLTLLLITSLAMLPLRAAFAMTSNNNMNMNTNSDNATMSEHCKNMKMDIPSNKTTNSDHANKSNGDCCKKGNHDCNHCTSHVSMIESETIKTINQTPNSFYHFSLTTVQTREFSPPLRPPLFHFI